MFEPGLLPQYRYDIPPELIASAPTAERDHSRLFVVDSQTGETHDDIFSDIGNWLPAGALIVFNETKVVPCRVELSKDTGGKLEILFLVDRGFESGLIQGLSNRNILVGRKLVFKSGETLEIVDQQENIFFFRPDFPIERLGDLFEKHGVMPIPKYLGESSLKEGELRDRYQTVFARKPGSVAAPTASLHFTEAVFSDLKKRGFDFAFIHLHVGLGTFSPVRPEHLADRKLHRERYEISREAAEQIAAAKKEGRPIVAVGTTVMRTLESAASLALTGQPASGETDLFIQPPYAFRVADTLITNFHVPESSLMCLVDAFLEYKRCPHRIMELYKEAIQKRFRFFSFGDSMLIR